MLKFIRRLKMPIYEYWCDSCQRKVSLYQRDICSPPPPCQRCGNANLRRMFSTFSTHKTYKDVYEDILSDRELSQGMASNDPKAMAEWNRRMSGGERTAPEYEEIVERMEGGEWPAEQIAQKRKEFEGQMTGEGSKSSQGE